MPNELYSKGIAENNDVNEANNSLQQKSKSVASKQFKLGHKTSGELN